MDDQSQSASQRASQLIGTRINNYEIKALLGEGGMGAVFVAEHPLIGRKVAVKVLKQEFAENRTLVNRFFNEARAANAIRHPNIIEVLDVGTLGSGLPYLIMPLLEGESLGVRLRRVGHLRVGDAVELAYQTASALVATHAKGIVHRDLKPDNLFLIPDAETPGRERVKILDFGIAKLTQELSGGAARTGTGSVMGTPPYMSPEQCKGITAEIDHRTDIYALGIIVYEMLCGAPPFVSQGFGEILMMHMTKAPKPPTSISPGIPDHLERAVLKALAKKREDRFGSMAEFQAALAAGPARTIATPSAVDVDPVASTLRKDEEADRLARRAGPGRGAAAALTVARPPTTISSASGEMGAVGDGDAPPPVGRSSRWIAIGVGGAALAGVLVVAATKAGPEKSKEHGTTSAPVEAPRTSSAPPPAPPPAAAVAPPPAAAAPEPVKPSTPPEARKSEGPGATETTHKRATTRRPADQRRRHLEREPLPPGQIDIE